MIQLASSRILKLHPFPICPRPKQEIIDFKFIYGSFFCVLLLFITVQRSHI
jgi:hypothetical protein